MEPSCTEQRRPSPGPSYFGMDVSELLRTITRLDARALRTERVHAKLEQEHRATQAALKQATDELDQVSRLAEIFYDLTLRLVDHMLGQRGASGNGQGRESANALLDAVLEQVERRESENDSGSVHENSAATGASATETDS